MNSSTTIIIIVFNLKGKRLRNFKFLLSNYLCKLNIKTIVAEQVSVNCHTVVSSLVESLNCLNVIYKQFEVGKPVFHKSYVINRVLEMIDTEYVWLLDADVFLRYADIISQINNQDIIQPYNHVFLLNEEDTLHFIKNKRFVAKKNKSFEVIKTFGPLSFIIKTELFKENPMNEEYIGYGWEDLDFAYRISQKFEITKLECNGLHLYHDVANLNKEQEKYNREIFFKYRKVLSFNNLELPKNVVFQNVAIQNINTNKTAKIVHIISPALLPHKQDLYKREILAIESIIKEKKHFKNIVCIMFSDSLECEKYKNEFEIIIPSRSSKDIGDNRGLPYFSDIFKEACKYCNDEDIVFYTNSDCCLASGTYCRLENTKTEAVEYHRIDVFNNPIQLQNVFEFHNELKETGVDGLAFRKNWFINQPYFVPDFFVGEPHWDTAICGALRTAGISSQNFIDLYHPFHKQTWDTASLSVAGKHNDKLYRDFIEYGISKIKILSKPEELIETSIVLVHYGIDEKRVLAAKKAMSHLCYQNILNVEFIFVDVIKDQTLFPEVDHKSNWVHMVLQEKEANKDIFQKEAMMNIGAKQAKGSIVIFVDTDIWSDNSNWLNSISDKIKDNSNKIVHGFSFCQDSKNPDHAFVSAGLNTCKNVESVIHENPGLVIGMAKYILVKNDYLNVYSIMGGGDSMTLHEYLSPKYPHLNAWFQASFPRLKNTLRELPICGIIDYIDCNIVHENHGDVDFGYYGARHYATEYFTKEIPELLVIGENGLLEWADPQCVEREIIRAKFNMKTEQITREICQKIKKGYVK